MGMWGGTPRSARPRSWCRASLAVLVFPPAPCHQLCSRCASAPIQFTHPAHSIHSPPPPPPPKTTNHRTAVPHDMISLGSGSSNNNNNNKKNKLDPEASATAAKDNSSSKPPRPSGASSLHYFPGLQSPLTMSPTKNKDVAALNGGSPDVTPEKQKRRSAGSSILNKIKRRSRKGHKDDAHHHKAGGATGAGGSPTAAPFLSTWLTESDRQNKLRTVVKVLTLLCFSPFFALQWAINKCGSANQKVLDWVRCVLGGQRDAPAPSIPLPLSSIALTLTSTTHRII